MSVLTKHRFTTQDYHQMAEAGVLKSDARVELLEGQIFDSSPIGPFHGGAINRLNRLFNNLSGGRWLVAVQNPVLLDEHSEPQPDLMLLKPAPDDYTTRHPGPADVLLLIEVADTSLVYDRGVKLSAYGRAGIREVWIVNLPEQTIEVCREPHFAGHGSTTVLRPGGQAKPLAFPDVGVEVAGLFQQGK